MTIYISISIYISIYISIGSQCWPRTYNGYKSFPFDLCITPAEALYKCIETDFKFF